MVLARMPGAVSFCCVPLRRTVKAVRGVSAIFGEDYGFELLSWLLGRRSAEGVTVAVGWSDL